MANHLGSEGTVRIGSTNIIAEVRNWSIEETSDTIEDTVLGDSARTQKTGLTSWSGSVDAYFDETDTNGQEAMTAGTEVNLRVYPESSGTPAVGEVYFDGQAIVTGITRSASFDGMTEASFSVQGNGALTKATVSV